MLEELDSAPSVKRQPAWHCGKRQDARRSDCANRAGRLGLPQMIVLDTHVWFWCWINLEHHRFSASMRTALETSESLGVSVVSCYNCAGDPARSFMATVSHSAMVRGSFLEPSGIQLLPLTPEVINRAVDLAAIHREPLRPNDYRNRIDS